MVGRQLPWGFGYRETCLERERVVSAVLAVGNVAAAARPRRRGTNKIVTVRPITPVAVVAKAQRRRWEKADT